MTTFYTNVQCHGGKILYRGIADGLPVSRKTDYSPTLFILSPKPSKFTTIHGEYVDAVKQGSIRDAKEFLDRYKDVEGFTIYGNQRHEYSYISDIFPNDIDWDFQRIV